MKPAYDTELVSAAVIARDALRNLLPVLTAALEQPQKSVHALTEARRVVDATLSLLLYTIKGRRSIAPRPQEAALTPWSVRRPN